MPSWYPAPPLACDAPVMAGWTLLLLNSAASRLRDEARRTRVIEAARRAPHLAGSAAEIVTSTDPEQLADAARSAAGDGADRVIVCGGDGTVVAVMAALAGSSVPLVILPGGTANILAGSMGIRGPLARVPELLRDGSLRPFDLGVAGYASGTPAGTEPMGSRTFGVAAGIGFDARVMAATTPGRKHRLGRLSYFASAIPAALSLRNVPCRITVDGRAIETQAAVVLVANAGQLIPGLVRPRFPIRPDDGLLDVFAIRGSNPLTGLRGALAALTGPVTSADPSGPAWRTRAQEARVETDQPEPVEVDGDVVGTGPLTARLAGNQVLVLVPAG
jgi:diacylglycerol kinase (ATP)